MPRRYTQRCFDENRRHGLGLDLGKGAGVLVTILLQNYHDCLYGLHGAVSASLPDASSELERMLKPVFIFPAHSRISKWLLRHRGVVSGLRLEVETRSSKSGISGNRRKLADSCSTKVLHFIFPSPREPTVIFFLFRLHHSSHTPFALASHLSIGNGSLCVFRNRNWVALQLLQVHEGHVNSVYVHPSEKVVPSIGKDRTLYMCDLMHGQRAASMILGFSKPQTETERCCIS